MPNNCKRCGQDIDLNEIHVFHGGEKRRAAIAGSLGRKTSLCGKPYTAAEIQIYKGAYSTRKNGDLVRLKESDG